VAEKYTLNGGCTCGKIKYRIRDKTWPQESTKSYKEYLEKIK